MKTYRTIAGLTALSIIILLLFNESLVNAQNKDLDRAKDLWEKVIAAKGGRERLYNVQNLVVESKSYSPYDKKEFSKMHLVDFYVLPDKLWSWQDQRPGFTLGINLSNFDKGIIYKLSEGSSVFIVRRLKSSDKSGGTSLDAKLDEQYHSEKEKFLENQSLYLMETKWFQPIIEGVRKERVGFKEIDVILVAFGNRKIEYYIDPKTNLPNKIRMRTWIELTKNYYEDGFFLEDYVEIGGIKFPQVIKRGKKIDTKTTYQVNVKYNESLFNVPPSIEAGPDAWK